MDHKEFFQLIKQDALQGAYILHGQEEYVKQSAVKNITAAINSSGFGEINSTTLPSADARTIMSACDTLPFFAEKRLVIVEAIPKDSDAKTLLTYLPLMPESTLLLFSIRIKDSHDTRYAKDGTESKLASLTFFKEMAKQKRTVSFFPLDTLEAARWVMKQASLLNSSIIQADARHLVAIKGVDCNELLNELKKLTAYIGDGSAITNDAIAKLVTPNLDYLVYAIGDYFMAGKVRDGYTALNSVLQKGEKPMDIARVLGDKCKLMLEARIMIDNKIKKEAVIERLGRGSAYGSVLYSSASRLKTSNMPSFIEATKTLTSLPFMQVTGRANERDMLEKALLLLAL